MEDADGPRPPAAVEVAAYFVVYFVVAESVLLGIRRRVAALDGLVTVTSPVGGPSMDAVELPYVW